MIDEQFFQQEALYELDLISQNLRRLDSGNVFLNRESSTFKAIADIFEKVEPKECINVILRKDGEEVTVELTNLSLGFSIRRSEPHVITSLNFPDMIVLLKREGERELESTAAHASLIGLESQLVLVDKFDPQNRLTIVPFGPISIITTQYEDEEQDEENEEEEHFIVRKRVTVDLGALRNPRFFEYRFDRRLRTVHPQNDINSASYLALLHAATSFPVPDPLTGVTGTARALQILQSARCSSIEPFSATTTEIFLSFLDSLVPKISPFPPRSQNSVKFEWKLARYFDLQSEQFLFVIQDLYNDSEQMNSFFKKESNSNLGGRVSHFSSSCLTLHQYRCRKFRNYFEQSYEQSNSIESTYTAFQRYIHSYNEEIRTLKFDQQSFFDEAMAPLLT